MKSLRQELVIIFGIIFVVICSAFSITSYINAAKVLRSSTEEALEQVAKQASGIISSSIQTKYKEMEAIAARADISDPSMPLEEKLSVLAEESDRCGNDRMAYIDSTGYSTSTNGKSQSLADREYFLQGMKGVTSLTDPTIGKSTGDLIVFYATPVRNNGKVIAVIQAVTNGNNLSTYTNKVSYGQTGFAYMIKKDGTFIAHPDGDKVMNCENVLTLAEEDDSFKSYAAAIEQVLASDSGITTYEYGGEKKYIGYSVVEGTTWKVIVEVSEAEGTARLASLRRTVVVASVLFILVGCGLSFWVSSMLGNNVRKLSNAIGALAKGDFTGSTYNMTYSNPDEIGMMKKAVEDTTKSISEAITEIKQQSTDVDMQSERLANSTDEISVVAENVSRAITDIANGTSSQSEELASISGILDEFANNIAIVVDKIIEIDTTSKGVGEKANHSTEEMNNLNVSVKNVSNAFIEFRKQIDNLGARITEISEITTSITEIANQTNLLALNASIEAARAGEAGRGFAVVAEEIGNLATQSHESSEKIGALVTGITDETKTIVDETIAMDNELMNQGTVIKTTMESFESIIAAIGDILPKIDTANQSVSEINEKKNTIITKVNGASSASEEVAASAEEIASAAEEMKASISEMSSIASVLKSQARGMHTSVDGFKTV